MFDEIVMKTILTIISFVVTGLLGYFVAKIKDTIQQDALKCLLRSSITKIYYQYIPQGSIPRFERENAIYLHEQYKNMNGNSYVDEIYPEILQLPIKVEK